jgi:hypothetical protein
VRDAPIQDEVARAVATGDSRTLFDRLERGSRLPGPRPNFDLADDVASSIAAARGRGDALVRALTESQSEFLVVVGVFALVRRWQAGIDPGGASEALQALCEDERSHVPAAIVDALRRWIGARGDSVVHELASWTDGYLGAHAVLEALADRTLLSRVTGGDAVVQRLDEAFRLADDSPRAHERLQGVRTLRRRMPAQIVVLATRFPGVVTWLATKTAAKRPETREVVSEAIRGLRKAWGDREELAVLGAALAGTAKPRRDADRVVKGTRKRGKR